MSHLRQPSYVSAPTYVYEGYQDNRRLESMLIVLESAGSDLERSTRRFREANDKLACFLGIPAGGPLGAR